MLNAGLDNKYEYGVGSLIVRLCIPLALFVWAVFAVCQLGDAAGD